MENKTLVLVRHAHRDTTFRAEDNGLSERGKSQALRIAERWIAEHGEDSAPLLLSSAKTRCIETLGPLSFKLGIAIEKEDLLMEQLPHESEHDLHQRVKRFIEIWKTTLPPLVVACTHGDWLPIAIDQLAGRFVDMAKGATTEVLLREGQVTLSQPNRLAE